MYGFARLKSKDYNEMEVLALEVRTDYELFDDYVDVFEFVQEKLNTTLIKYSSLDKEKYEAAFSFSEDGFTIFEKYLNGIIVPYIFYNDMVPYSYETIGIREGIKIIKGKNGLHYLPVESNSSNAYIKSGKDGNFNMMRIYNSKHYIEKEIAFHPEGKLDKSRKRILNIHEYDGKGNFNNRTTRLLTESEYNNYKKYFGGELRWKVEQ